MKTLFLAWQDREFTRRWFPIGRLDADVERDFYQFGYIQGVKKAEREAGFKPLDAFPNLTHLYKAHELFPLFKNRVLNRERQDFSSFLQQLAISPEAGDPLTILSVSGGSRRTDNLEVFPKIDKTEDNQFKVRFLLRGWRHLTDMTKERVKQLQVGEKLFLSVELHNPVTGIAIQVQTGQYEIIGWTPRYLVMDIMSAIGADHLEIAAKVVQMNPPPAPAQDRVLIEIAGKWPDNYTPMNGPDFKTLWNEN